MTDAPFTAPKLLRNQHIQSFLASSGLRRKRFVNQAPELHAATEERLLSVLDQSTQLQGMYSKHPQSRGLAVLFHGWEGSVDSTYLLDLAAALWASGLSIFRLHFRDHGSTHHLNEGLFHSCRLDEVVDAVGQICEEIESGPVFLAGYSLGGNFALRVARSLQDRTDRIRHVFGICPVIDPARSLRAIEDALWHYEAYFLLKWRRSLKIKQTHFPERYRHAPVRRGLRLVDMTAYLVQEYTDFANVDEYFDGYAIKGDYLSDLRIDATIVACVDDPVIPIDDFHELKLASRTQLIINQQGGHCGMVDQLWGPSWATRLINHRISTLLNANTR